MLDRSIWLQSYIANPVGVRNERGGRFWCFKCYSDNLYVVKTKAFTFCRCKDCGFEWDFGPCWSCQSEQVDSRDPATPACACGWYKCIKCGACNLRGCKTNPYSRRHRYTDEKDDTDEADLEVDEAHQCEWCGSPGAYHETQARLICERCAESLVDDC